MTGSLLPPPYLPAIISRRCALRSLSKTKRLFFFSCLIACLTSCHDVIFYKIENEVKLEDAAIEGEIHDIVRFTNDDGDYLYVDNGQIKYKKALSTNNDDWAKHMTGLSKLKYDYYDSEFSGVQIVKVACDTDNLYALGVEWEIDEDEGENMPRRWIVYTSKGPGKEWKEVWTLRRTSSMKRKYLRRHGIVSMFCTNTYDKANRMAFLRVSIPNDTASGGTDTVIYLLDGETKVDASCEYTSGIVIGAQDTSAWIYDATYFKGDVYFLNAYSDDSAIGTDETPETEDAAGVSAAHIYYSSGDYLYYSTNPAMGWTKTDPDVSGEIISMALTADYFILGTDGGGLYRVQNEDGVPTGDEKSFDTNADVALGSPYTIRSIYCIDPAKNETDAVIYATADFSGSTSGSMDDIGLWSYYPSRGNWNRE